MHEDEIRALVRDVVARHLGAQGAGSGAQRLAVDALPGYAGPPSLPLWKTHTSHGRFLLVAPTDPDAPCIVEPQVRCHHCGFCQSYGH